MTKNLLIEIKYKCLTYHIQYNTLFVYCIDNLPNNSINKLSKYMSTYFSNFSDSEKSLFQ